jgi:hypothetical protein
MLKRIGVFILALSASTAMFQPATAFAQEYDHRDRDYYAGDHWNGSLQAPSLLTVRGLLRGVRILFSVLAPERTVCAGQAQTVPVSKIIEGA